MLEKRFFHQMNKEKLINKGDKVLLAISGGADSVALFYLLQSIEKTYQLNISLAYVNHQLRADSGLEEKFIRKLAKEENYPLFMTYWENNSQTQIEARAREFRYQFFQKTAQEQGITKIITAHHGDDLLETILMKFIRGSYLPHLSGIRAKRNQGDCQIIRPLLNFSKAELESYLLVKNATYAYDISNESQRYFRNRIRTNIVPHIRRENPNYIAKVNQFSKETIYLADYLKSSSQDFLSKHLRMEEKGFTLNGLKHLNTAQRFVYISQTIEQNYQGTIEISQSQMSQILDGLAQKQFPLTIKLPGNAFILLKSDELQFLKG